MSSRTLPENIPLFDGIAPRDVNAMLSCLGSFRRSVPKGTFLLLGEDEIRCVGVVLSGQVNMVKNDLAGNAVILAVVKPRELFGETFACGLRQAATVAFQAVCPSEVLFLPFTRVVNECSNSCAFHHRLIENMMRLIAEKNMRFIERAEITAQKTLREKILTYLSFQSEGRDGSYIVSPLGKREMAEYLCADRTALSRELSRMKAEGIIDFDKNTYRIL
ncbi:MAG: Crp/Fnr family transcriptional regulator [Oscillospiraceae bacterium]|nr:Crp/Fnr family transcriptional regulator [Oscillospiraceae bacterium]